MKSCRWCRVVTRSKRWLCTAKRSEVYWKRCEADTDLKKVNGTAKFGIDIHIPGWKHCSSAFPGIWRQKVKSYNATSITNYRCKKVLQIPSGIAVIANHFWAANQGWEALEWRWSRADSTYTQSIKIQQLVAIQYLGTGSKRRCSCSIFLKASK